MSNTVANAAKAVGKAYLAAVTTGVTISAAPVILPAVVAYTIYKASTCK